MHVLRPGNRRYYGDYADQPTSLLARCLVGFAYQGQSSKVRKGKPRGTPSADLAPTSFVLFLQNHDQIGNRPFGERLSALSAALSLAAAVALQILSPHIPLLFMGEEHASPAPFLYFTDHHGDLADAVREGRRREFASFAAFSSEETRSTIPDPNDRSTFERSRPFPGEGAAETRALYASLLALRQSTIVPRLAGARSLSADVIGPAAVVARWRMGMVRPTIATNLGKVAVPFRDHPGRLSWHPGGAKRRFARRSRNHGIFEAPQAKETGIRALA
jgi:1,4-alpha-glucan branching enzyme